MVCFSAFQLFSLLFFAGCVLGGFLGFLVVDGADPVEGDGGFAGQIWEGDGFLVGGLGAVVDAGEVEGGWWWCAGGGHKKF